MLTLRGMNQISGKSLALAFFALTLSCEYPKSPSSQFLFDFQKSVEKGNLDEFLGKLFRDPRDESDLDRVKPFLISDIDGAKLPLAESGSKELLKQYLSGKLIDFSKTTTVVNAGLDFEFSKSESSSSKFTIKTFDLKDANKNPILRVDLWTEEELPSGKPATAKPGKSKYYVGDVVIYSRLP